MSYPWPKEGQKLFKSGSYYQIAHFGWGGQDSQFHGYIRGYKEAADNLVDLAIKSENIAVLDTYVFPIVFLYRQFLELSMKEIYLNYSEHSTEDKVKTIDKAGHNLLRIWNEIKPLIQEGCNSNDDDKTIKVVEDYINQFHAFDKTSFTFRYPITKKLAPTLDKEYRIDLLNLKQRIDELGHFFSGVDGQLDANKENKYEQQKEFMEIIQQNMWDEVGY
ncbi:hypothetical protein ACKE5C_11180 [Aneurinibacillus thermoaerophilus]|uniref:HEPN domain-containing protein n=1 Tax=Aneurinibacillus thermoaerophilus TaxID=143495 RepID=A0ABX8Y740_ANETH|nr:MULTISPECIES: hypothetical protein [Aneurinibacillus]AMA72761.1 hypothetical protein ACH33_07775 [Aneurinibacillus sp. XH2]QYY41476.1 hypothetical protein K3F53_11045 [Aneurinibacillus thermoaerophilus]